MSEERRSHRRIAIFVGVVITNILLVLGFVLSDPWVRGSIDYKLRTPIVASAGFLAPYTSYSFVYEIAFIGALAVILLLVGMVPLLRRLYFAVVLIPIGVFDFFILPTSGGSYTVPPDVFILPFVTIASGIIVPVLYSIRQFFNKKDARLLLILSGCSELALGAISLYYMPIVTSMIGGYQQVYTDLSSAFLLLGALQSTVAVYSLAVGTFLFRAEPKSGNLPKEMV